MLWKMMVVSAAGVALAVVLTVSQRHPGPVRVLTGTRYRGAVGLNQVVRESRTAATDLQFTLF